MVEQLAATVHICLQQKGQQLWTKAKPGLSTLLCLLWKAPKCSSASEAATERTHRSTGVFRGHFGAPLTVPQLLSLAASDCRLTFPTSVLTSFCFCFAKCSLKQVRAEKWSVGSISGFSLVLPLLQAQVPSQVTALP